MPIIGVCAHYMDTCEPGYYYDVTQPIGQKCVTPKECQRDDVTQPICTVIIGDMPVTLYRKTATDACQTIILFTKV